MVPPDGITEERWQERSPWQQRLIFIPTLLISLVVLAGLVGLLGAPDTARRASSEAATLEVFGPRLIRNGEFFEMRFRVDARRPIEQTVIAVDKDIWEDITVNTMIPAATEETFEGDEFRFSFGKLEAGRSLLFKLDGQLNPDIRGSNSGRVTVYDKDRELVSLDYSLVVLP